METRVVVAEDLCHSRKGKPEAEADQEPEYQPPIEPEYQPPIKACATCLLLKELQTIENLLLLLHRDTGQEEEEVEEEEAGEEEEVGEEEEAGAEVQGQIFQMILTLQPHYYSITE